jgi:hypothetical protein
MGIWTKRIRERRRVEPFAHFLMGVPGEVRMRNAWELALAVSLGRGPAARPAARRDDTAPETVGIEVMSHGWPL